MSILCRHFGTCGGCTLQDMRPADYRTWKHQRVGRALERHGLGEVSVELPAEVAPRSRRRATLKAARKDAATNVGFRAARSHIIVDMQECHILTPALAALVMPLRKLMGGFLREGEEAELRLTEAENGFDIALNMTREADAMLTAALARWGAQNGVARFSVNGEIAVQFAPPRVQFSSVEVALPIDSFLQPTGQGEERLQDGVREAVNGAKRIADLFAGCGTFTFSLARTASVHAVDSDALALAALLAAARKGRQLKPVTVETRNLFKRPLAGKELDRFEAVVIDPPRRGALSQVKTLAASRVRRVAYVSCNPDTFAQDARILVDGGFRASWVRPVDQFLWSSHIELVASLERY